MINVRGSRDDGFTLIEVIVALGLLGIVASAAVTFLVRGLKDSSSIDQRSTAVTLAGQGMEQVRAIAAAKTNGVITGLVAGRAASDVTSQWTDAANLAGASVTADMWPASDASAVTPSTGAVVPLTSDPKVGGWTFHRSVLIGTCYRARGTTTGASCGKQGAADQATAAASSSNVAMDRVVVLVSWTPLAGGTCASTSCSYSTTGLVDPNGDLTWNQDGTLKAVDDTATVNAGSSATISVLTNDVGTPSATNPVTITQAPSAGTASVDSSGVVTYTPASGASGGTVTFQYTFTSTHGTISNTATVTVTVKAKPVAGSYSVNVPASSASSPSAVDLGILSHAANADSSATLAFVDQLVSSSGDPGTLTNSGASALLAPTSNTLGKRTFTYTLTENGMTSDPGTVTVSIVPVGGSYAQTAAKGAGAVPVNVPALDVNLLQAGWTQLSLYSLPPNQCGTISQSGSGYVWNVPSAVPSSSTSCVATYTQKGNKTGLTDLSASSSLTFTVTG